MQSELAKGTASVWPYVRTVEECKHVEPALLSQDASGALDECRSRTAGRFLMAAGARGHRRRRRRRRGALQSEDGRAVLQRRLGIRDSTI